MSPHHGRHKFLLRILLLSVCFYLYFVNYSKRQDFLSKSIGQTQKSNPNKVLFDSTMKYRTEAKNLSAMREFPYVSRIPEPGKLTLEERNHILNIINISNEEQTIYNAQTFGPLTKDTFVIVIQVHFRFEYLKFLVQSLADAEGINDSLIIFSHDVYSPEMNAAIQQINFARILQIFFPISRQTDPKKTWGPGYWKIGSRALAKQHWWWKAHFVFNKKYEGVIQFLEEDDYVIPDYIAVMKKLEVRMRENDCSGCNVLIGGHIFYGGEIRNSWNKGKHNMAAVSEMYDRTVNRGLAFNRTLWNKIKACEKTFRDTFKDINLDFSLTEVSTGCMTTSRLKILTPEASRLFRTGDCGMNFQDEVCNPLPEVVIIKKYIKQFEYALFPQNISLISLKFINNKVPQHRSRPRWIKKDAKLCFLLGH